MASGSRHPGLTLPCMALPGPGSAHSRSGALIPTTAPPAPGAEPLSGASEHQCGLLQSLLPCQEGRGDTRGVPRGQGLLLPAEPRRGSEEALPLSSDQSFPPSKAVLLAC